MTGCSKSKLPNRRVKRHFRWRGMALVLVLGLLAVTLAISYATLRSQATTSDLARNGSRGLDAREAAQSGLAAALRKISESGWAGADKPLSANVTPNSWYQVSFTTGDAKLAASDSQYAEYPFRLTIDSAGYAADPLNPAIQAQYRSRCVVQLIRKQLVAEPASWSSVANFAVYQFANKDVYTQFPVRISGPACLHGKLQFCTEYPNSNPPRNRYLTDLNTRRLAGHTDDRPFPEKMTIALAAQDNTTMSLLTGRLGMTLVDTTASKAAPVEHPGAVLGYRLYPGGKEYTLPIIQSEFGNPIQNVTIAPDPMNNPLGIYRSTGPLSIQSNVHITGTIITDGSSPEIQIYGTNVSLQPYTLPAIYGSTQGQQLPAALVLDDLRVNSNSEAQIHGATVVWDEFELKAGTATSKFAMTGNLITSSLLLRGRIPWVQSPVQWDIDRTLFRAQTAIPYFPDYLEVHNGFVVKPTLTFAADSSGVHPHWHDWSQPIYQPDTSDDGLRWDVVRWEDNL